jgi:hypothetical protein
VKPALFLEEFFDFGYVVGDVHAYGVVVYFGDADFPAIFEPAELLELLDFFEGALRESGVFEKGVALEDVQAQMLEVADFHFGGGIAEPGDGSAGEVQRVFVEVEDGFYDVGIHDVGWSFYGGGDAGDRGGCVFKKGANSGVDDFGVEERFVTLDIHENLAIGVSGNFRNALGAGAVLGAGHAGFAAESFDGLNDAVVIGGDDDAGGELGEFGAFIDALDHGGTSQRYQGFTGQAGGTVASWNYDDDVGWTHKISHLDKMAVPKCTLSAKNCYVRDAITRKGCAIYSKYFTRLRLWRPPSCL